MTNRVFRFAATNCRRDRVLSWLGAWAVVGAFLVVPPAAIGSISWDAEAGTQWWFDPVNWNANGNINNALPPSNGTVSPPPTDTLINHGTGSWDLGSGVLYDPIHDPNFAAAQSAVYPAGFGPQIIQQLYISRNSPTTNLLTIKGDLTASSTVVVGRSSGLDGVTSNGSIVQSGGTFAIIGTLDIAGSDIVNAGIANGTYDYRGGILDVSGSVGLRLSTGSSSINAITGEPAGASGVGKFVVHNPSSGGHVRTFAMSVAAYGGIPDSVNTIRDPNGITTGVGIVEFHFENGNTRPLQIAGNLSINNGFDASTFGIRSSRLDLKLDSAPAVNGSGVPQNLGLFDVDFDPNDFVSGAITGTGSLGRVFSSADNSTLYTEGATVSAQFGSKIYNWTISYAGDIKWTDVDNSMVSAITGVGTGNDVVLIGTSSFNVPEPRSLVLLIVGLVSLMCFQKRNS